ncbi:MAG: precorrin-3B C(17)-methyltransferase [Pseudomonadota bacterium]
MAVTPVVLALSRSGEAVARRVADHLGAPLHGRAGRVDAADAFFPNAVDHARDLFAAGIPIIGVCASGILIRAVAPLLNDKTAEPPVIAVSEDGAVVIPLLGGHRGANRIARDISEALGAVAAVSTAGDVALGIALDAPPSGHRLTNPENAKAVMAGLLAGEQFTLNGNLSWLEPVAELANVRRGSPRGPASLVGQSGARMDYVAQRYTLGVGCARGCPSSELNSLIERALNEAGITRHAVAAINTIGLKADERAVLEAAAWLGAPLRLFTATALEAEHARLKNPSDRVFQEVGCHGVAEGAALAAAGPDAGLVIEKRKTPNATCAIAKAPDPISELRGAPRGHVALVGIGPGQAAWRTPEASSLVARAEVLVGYGLYIDLLGPLAAGKTRHDFPLGGEEDRCRFALEQAGQGRRVALICSGDAGIYAMGALIFELLDRGTVSDAARRVEVITSPGISAMQAAAARAGAPLGHDFCAISLSDLLTPREAILRRIRAAAEGDFVIAFYNPVSKRRRDLLPMARDILLKHRPADCPVLLASSLGRPSETHQMIPLDALDPDNVDMLTLVMVGSSQSRVIDHAGSPQMYTPRGYAKKMKVAE